MYSTGLGHGDALHVSDLIPARPGLEVFAAHESMGQSGNRGATMRDARTGAIIWDIPATKDTGRAAAGDIDPRHPGAEGWAVGGDAAWNSRVGQLKSSTGELVSTTIPAANYLAWWDGDPLREIVDHDWNPTTSVGTPTIAKWNWETNTADVLLADPNARSNNSTKGTPAIQADLFGDWREEIAWRSADSSELRIYSTPHPTDRRLPTLMHDPVYRLGVAWQNTAYNQPPHASYFIGQDMAQPKPPSIVVRESSAIGGDGTFGLGPERVFSRGQADLLFELLGEMRLVEVAERGRECGEFGDLAAGQQLGAVVQAVAAQHPLRPDADIAAEKSLQGADRDVEPLGDLVARGPASGRWPSW